MPDPTVGLVGQTIASQFHVEKRLGSGGMGAVYLAEQLGMDRHVVVKVMHPELTAGSPSAVERFKREARAVAQLNHPNIVQVYVFGETQTGQMYIAMEYIEGSTLTDALEHGPLPQVRALLILDQVCSALVEAHGAGIVHRDLKPDNIMLTDRHGNPDYVKVLDFGIAKLAEQGDAHLTKAGEVFGTPRYMAPEQAKGGHIDARTDIYALGLILYEMLTAQHPYPTATTAIEYIIQHTTGEMVPLREAAPEGKQLSPRLDAIVERCVQREPEARYQSVRELQRDVRATLRDFPEAQRGFPTNEPDPRAAMTLAAGSSPAPASVATGRGASPASARAARAASVGAAGAPREGTPAWVWGLAGVLIAGGIATGVALGVGGAKAPGTPPVTTVAAAPDGPGLGDAGAAAAKTEVDAGSTGQVTAEAPPATAPETLPPPETGPPPETDVAEGMPIDGFPVPARSRSTMSAPQAEMLESDLPAGEIIAFYKAKLAGKYGPLQDIPNGIMLTGTKSPFSTVSLVNMGGDRVTIALTRNTLWERPGGAGGAGDGLAGQTFLGLTAPSDASIVVKTPQAIVLRSRLPLSTVCKHFTDQVGQLEGVTVVKDLEAAQPYCTIVATQNEQLPWQALSILDDPSSAGAVMISMSARTK